MLEMKTNLFGASFPVKEIIHIPHTRLSYILLHSIQMNPCFHIASLSSTVTSK